MESLDFKQCKQTDTLTVMEPHFPMFSQIIHFPYSLLMVIPKCEESVDSILKLIDLVARQNLLVI